MTISDIYSWLLIHFFSIERRHLEVLQRLIDMGAQVNNHDLAGCTPLHHCMTSYAPKGQEYLLKLSEMLLVNGADINSVNRLVIIYVGHRN